MAQITDVEALATFVVDHINRLYAGGICCPQCCWPCDALKCLAERPDGPGSLTSILTYAPIDAYAYRTSTGAIDRERLAEAWNHTDCHVGEDL
jgi:hypothetical protein